MADDAFFEQAAETFLSLTWQSRHRPLSRDVSNLSVGETGVLLFLSEQPGQVTAGDIGKGMQIGSGGVANLLNALEKKGYVSRNMSPTDRRSVVVTLSPQGAALIEERKREILRHTAAFLWRMGEEDTLDMLRLFRKVLTLGDQCLQNDRKDTENNA